MFDLLALFLAFGMVCLIFSETIITVPNAACFSYRKDQQALVFTKKLLDGDLLFQVNAQIYWDYTGAYDEMRMYQRAYDYVDTASLSASELEDFQQQLEVFENERRVIEQQDAYDTEFNVGASLTYRYSLKADEVLQATLFVQNLFSDRNRYYVNTGSSNYFPNRLNFVKEPRVMGVRVAYCF